MANLLFPTRALRPSTAVVEQKAKRTRWDSSRPHHTTCSIGKGVWPRYLAASQDCYDSPPLWSEVSHDRSVPWHIQILTIWPYPSGFYHWKLWIIFTMAESKEFRTAHWFAMQNLVSFAEALPSISSTVAPFAKFFDMQGTHSSSTDWLDSVVMEFMEHWKAVYGILGSAPFQETVSVSQVSMLICLLYLLRSLPSHYERQNKTKQKNVREKGISTSLCELTELGTGVALRWLTQAS